MAGFLGKKLGMTQFFTDDGSVERVTVVEAGPCHVTALRTAERDGYDAVQLGFGEVAEKRLQKARMGHLRKADAPPVKHLAEFRGDPSAFRREAGEDDGGLKLGDKLTLDQVFEVGETVKVAGKSKGKGFQGTVKRHGFSRGPVSHGSHNVRAPGSIGASATPSRVMKGIRGPGRMGGGRITQRGLRIVGIRPDENLLLLRGSVPGPRGGTVEIRKDA